MSDLMKPINRPPTPRQSELMRFIYQSINENQSPPTIVEMMAHMGVASPTSIIGLLTALQRKGMITRDSKARGIKIVWSDWRLPGGRCPTCGSTHNAQGDGS